MRDNRVWHRHANAAELVLNGVLRVCRDMNVDCSQAQQQEVPRRCTTPQKK